MAAIQEAAKVVISNGDKTMRERTSKEGFSLGHDSKTIARQSRVKPFLHYAKKGFCEGKSFSRGKGGKDMDKEFKDVGAREVLRNPSGEIENIFFSHGVRRNFKVL